MVQSKKCPSVVPELKNFERDLFDLINKIEYKNVKNELQLKMKNDIRNIKDSNRVILAADKSPNLYKVTKDDYSKYITENITKEYKKRK